MNTLIVYATKYGATRDIVERIAEKLDGTVKLCNLKEDGVPALPGYDCILIGGPVYAGSIRKELRQFMQHCEGALWERRFGLFLTGLGGPQGSDRVYFANNFSPETLEAAAFQTFVGGVYDPKKVSGLERFIVKTVTKTGEFTDSVDDSAIDTIVRDVMGG